MAGTCKWITHDASYIAWVNGAGDDVSNNDNTLLLWISGRPSKGKTRQRSWRDTNAHRADVKVVDNNGWTVLQWAALGENKTLVQLLLNSVAGVNATENDGKTVLHWAAEKENEGVVRLLVDFGAHVKAKNNRRGTVLHCS
jgi:ankyrin repeat protein